MSWVFIICPGYLSYVLGIYYMSWVFTIIMSLVNAPDIYYMSWIFAIYVAIAMSWKFRLLDILYHVYLLLDALQGSRNHRGKRAQGPPTF